MKKQTSRVIRSFIFALALSSTSLTVQARESLESLRNDLNASVTQINALQNQNAVQQTQINALQTQVDTLNPKIYKIGDIGPAGGIVFYVSNEGIHGLEAAPTDQASAPWGCWGQETGVGATATVIGSGGGNTGNIITYCSEINTAAHMTDDFELNGFSDWFLPSKDEINLLYSQKDVVGGFVHDQYWSSSEGFNFSGDAWYQSFIYGYQDPVAKTEVYGVRAIRAF